MQSTVYAKPKIAPNTKQSEILELQNEISELKSEIKLMKKNNFEIRLRNLKEETHLDCDKLNIYSMLYIENGNKLLIGHLTGEITIWNMENNEHEKTFIEHKEGVNALISLEKMKTGYFASAGNDNYIKIWNIYPENQENDQNIKSVKTIQANDSVLSLTYPFDYHKDCIIYGESESKLIVYNLINSLITELPGHSSYILSLLYITNSPSENYVLSGSYKIIKMWDLKKLVCINNFMEHFAWVRSMVRYKDKFFSTGDDGLIKLWNLFESSSSLFTINQFQNNPLSINSIIIIEDYLVAGGDNKRIEIYDLEKYKKIKMYKTNENIFLLVKLSSSQLNEDCVKIAYSTESEKETDQHFIKILEE
jgi:WD40 repeat protein